MNKKPDKKFKRRMIFPASPYRLTDFESGDEIPADVLGSYTGSPEDGEEPVQDADDL